MSGDDGPYPMLGYKRQADLFCGHTGALHCQLSQSSISSMVR